MSATFSGLSTDEVDTNVQCFLNVLGVSNHVHDRNTCLVESFDNFNGRNTDGADEERGLFLDDNIDECVQVAFGVIVLG